MATRDILPITDLTQDWGTSTYPLSGVCCDQVAFWADKDNPVSERYLTTLNIGSGDITEYVELSITGPDTDVLYTLAHGLSDKPKFVETFLQCQTSNLGYTSGETLAWGGFIRDNRISIRVDSTNLYVCFDRIEINRKSDHNASVITPYKWKLIFHVFY